MPYITPDRREAIDLDGQPLSAGELNYAVTKLLKEYVDAAGLSYQAINDCLGALDGARAEFYRRVAVPYEDAKIKANGDVY